MLWEPATMELGCTSRTTYGQQVKSGTNRNQYTVTSEPLQQRWHRLVVDSVGEIQIASRAKGSICQA